MRDTAHKLYDAEYRLAAIVWESEPVGSTELVRLCGARLGWSKSTTYTVLRKLCQKGVLSNTDATVTSLVKREDTQRYESEALIEKAFDGSLPRFLTAFLDGRQLSEREADELKRIIDQSKGEELQ